MPVEPTTQDKQITIEVPEDRVAEFYAFFGHFLAGLHGRRRRGPGHHRGHRGHGPCHHRGGPHHDERDHESAEPAPGTGADAPAVV